MVKTPEIRGYLVVKTPEIRGYLVVKTLMERVPSGENPYGEGT